MDWTRVALITNLVAGSLFGASFSALVSRSVCILFLHSIDEIIGLANGQHSTHSILGCVAVVAVFFYRSVSVV